MAQFVRHCSPHEQGRDALITYIGPKKTMWKARQGKEEKKKKKNRCEAKATDRCGSAPEMKINHPPTSSLNGAGQTSWARNCSCLAPGGMKGSDWKRQKRGPGKGGRRRRGLGVGG